MLSKRQKYANEAAANAEHYIDCDGCTSSATGAQLDRATGSLYLTTTDANGNVSGIAGTTISDWSDPQSVSTNVEVSGGAAGAVTMSGYGVGLLAYYPYANLSLPPAVIYDPHAPPALPKLKGKNKRLCLWRQMTNEMLGGEGGPSDSSDTAPRRGGAAAIPFHTTTRGGKPVTRRMGVSESGDGTMGGVQTLWDYAWAAAA